MDGKVVVSLAALTALIGCGPTPVSTVPPPIPIINYSEMSLGDHQAYAAAAHVKLPQKLTVFCPGANFQTINKIYPEGAVLTGAYLRNPGGMLFIFEGIGSKPITASNRLEFEKRAKQAGATVGDIPYRFGPDGRTPMVLQSHVTYERAETSGKISPITIQLEFGNHESAMKATHYIDKSFYKVVVAKKKVEASCRGPVASVSDEMEEFERIAKEFGGKVVSGSTEESSYVSPADHS